MSNELKIINEEKQLVLEGDPRKQIEYAKKASKALLELLSHKKNKVMIQGKQYAVFEDWQTLARFYGVTVGVEWTKPVLENGLITGYEARSIAYHKGDVISAAEAMCMKNEKNWYGRPEFMIRSMAQTRASAKALRNILAWVMVMGGIEPTPAEEMDGLESAQDRVGRMKNEKTSHDIINPNEAARKVIFNQLKRLGVIKENMSEFTKERTKLELIPENYEEIVNRLDILIQEMSSVERTNEN